MGRIFDLTREIDANHFRWKVNIESFTTVLTGKSFQVTKLVITSHIFTHIDAPKHIDESLPSIDSISLSTLIGEGFIMDLSYVKENQRIDIGDLRKHEHEIKEGDIVILSTQWDEKRDFHDLRFWDESPYLSKGAVEWLIERKIKMVGFDFPQDYEIRGRERGEKDERWIAHNVFLSSNIPQMEYLKIPREVLGKRVTIIALPLKIKGIDGSPCRVICILGEG